MTDTSSRNMEASEVELLLPWYVSGKLDAADVMRVEAYLAEHPEMQLQVDLIREDMDVVVRANEVISPSPARALDRIMREIEATPQSQSTRSRAQQATRGVVQFVEQWLGGVGPRRLAFATIAAAALIVLQAGLIGGLMLQGYRTGQTYVTASGEQGQRGTFVLVQFKPGAELSAVTAFLERYDAQVVSGPISGGVFKLRMGDAPLDDNGRAALVKRIGGEAGLIEKVLPSQ